MIAVDTSSMARFLAGEHGTDIDSIFHALASDEIGLPAIVLTELLSNPLVTPAAEEFVLSMHVLGIMPGHWERAALMRRSFLAEGLRAKLPDTLIAQSCIDHDIPLITYDRDFRHFVRAGLKFA